MTVVLQIKIDIASTQYNWLTSTSLQWLDLVLWVQKGSAPPHLTRKEI